MEEESCDLSRGSSGGLKGFSGWHQEPGAHDCNRGEVGEPEARTGTVVSYWLIFSPKYLAWSLAAKHCSGHFISASPLILIAILLVGRVPFIRIREIKQFSQSHTAGGTQSEIWTKTVSPASLGLHLQPHLEHILKGALTGDLCSSLIPGSLFSGSAQCSERLSGFPFVNTSPIFRKSLDVTASK